VFVDVRASNSSPDAAVAGAAVPGCPTESSPSCSSPRGNATILAGERFHHLLLWGEKHNKENTTLFIFFVQAHRVVCATEVTSVGAIHAE